MMLMFNHEKCLVVTSSWTMSFDKTNRMEIAYLWGADGVALFSSATSVRRLTVPITQEYFTRTLMLAPVGGVLDLRKYQSRGG